MSFLALELRGRLAADVSSTDCSPSPGVLHSKNVFNEIAR
jgi:hypothetical protein